MRIHWRLLLSRHSGFCRLLLSRCRCGRTRALAPLNALVHALLAKAVSPSFWQGRPYGAEDARSHEAGARNREYSADAQSPRFYVGGAAWTLVSYVRAYRLLEDPAWGCKRRGPPAGSRGGGTDAAHLEVLVAPLLCVCTKVARSWVARPRLACPGCRRSTSGLVRSQCRTSWPSPSERSPNPARVRVVPHDARPICWQTQQHP